MILQRTIYFIDIYTKYKQTLVEGFQFYFYDIFSHQIYKNTNSLREDTSYCILTPK